MYIGISFDIKKFYKYVIQKRSLENIAFPEVIGKYAEEWRNCAKKKRKVNSAYAPKMPSGP